jgi:hypothetical protein
MDSQHRLTPPTRVGAMIQPGVTANLPAVFLRSIGLAVILFSSLVWLRPHYTQSPFILTWPTKLDHGNVYCHWDTGHGFQSQEWLSNTLVAHAESHKHGMHLPSLPIQRLRVRTTSTNPTPIVPSHMTVGNTDVLAGTTVSPRILRPLSDRTLSSIQFDGRSDYIACSQPLRVRPHDPFTISFWFRRDSNEPVAQTLVSTWTANRMYTAFFMGWGTDGTWRLSGNCDDISVGNLLTDTWYHLVLSHSPNRTRVYLNTSLIAEVSNLSFDTQGPLIIGRQGELAAEYFHGQLANFRIYPCECQGEEVEREFKLESSLDTIDRSVIRLPQDSIRADSPRGGLSLTQISSSKLPVLVETVIPFQSKWQITRSSRVHIAAHLMCVIGLLLAINSFRRFVKLHRHAPAVARMGVVFFLLCTTPSFLFLGVTYPGYFNNDAMECWSQALSAQMDDLHPVIYLLHLKALSILWPSLAAATLFQICCFGLVFSTLLAWLYHRGLSRFRLFFVALTLGSLPALVIYNCYPQKDVLSSLLLIAVASIFYVLAIRKQEQGLTRISNSLLIAFGTLIALFSSMRYNNNFNIIIIPVVIAALRLIPLRQIVGLWLIATSVFIFTQIFLPKALEVQPKPPFFFQGMAITNPLAALLNAPKSSDIDVSEDERSRLHQLFGLNADQIRAAYQPHDANYIFYQPTSRIGNVPSPEDRSWLTWFYIRKLVLRYPHIFLGDRIMMFTQAIWSPPYTFVNFRDKYHIIRKCVGVTGYTFYPHSYIPGLNSAADKFVLSVERRRHLFWNSAPGLLLCFLSVVLNRWLPHTAIFSLIILLQVPIIFVSMPMAYFKYVHFLYPMMLLVPLLAYQEITNKRRRSI